MQLLQYTARLLVASGRRNSYNTLTHCLGAVGSAILAMHCLTAQGGWAVELMQCASPSVVVTGSLAKEAVAA